MTMECSRTRERLEDIALGAAAAPEIETHVASCQDCGAALSAFRDRTAKLDERLRRLVSVEVPDGLRGKIAYRLNADAERQSTWPTVAAMWATSLLASATTVAIGLFFAQQYAQRSASDRAYDSAVVSAASDISEWRSPTTMLLVRQTDEQNSATQKGERGNGQ